jgi:hypothetical protein
MPKIYRIKNLRNKKSINLNKKIITNHNKIKIEFKLCINRYMRNKKLINN